MFELLVLLGPFMSSSIMRSIYIGLRCTVVLIFEILNPSFVGIAVVARARVLLIYALIELFFLGDALLPRGTLVLFLLVTACGRCCLDTGGMLRVVLLRLLFCRIGPIGTI